jgi:hypothetical protein
MIIATRTLKYDDQDVLIQLFTPVRTGEKAWACRFRIDWPDRVFELDASGIDAVQALHIALQLIGVHIYTSEYHESGKLCLDEPGKGYGFPVPSTARDLLIGDDAKYF